MQNEFVPYNESLALQELGFNEPCFANYNIEGILQPIMLIEKQNTNSYFVSGGYFKEVCTAPTFSQCFRFFRERYSLHQNITQYYGEHFYYKIEDMVHPRRFDEYPLEKLRNLGEYSSHIKAELWCLKHLIKLAKNK